MSDSLIGCLIVLVMIPLAIAIPAVLTVKFWRWYDARTKERQ